jgi:hypothetical protein
LHPGQYPAEVLVKNSATLGIWCENWSDFDGFAGDKGLSEKK